MNIGNVFSCQVGIVVPEIDGGEVSSLSVENLFECEEENQIAGKKFILHFEKEISAQFVIFLKQADDTIRYLILTLENCAIFEGHHVILELCFQYDAQSQELSVTGFRKFLSVKEPITEITVLETDDFSQEKQEKLLSEYSKIFRETTEECSLVTIMLDTAVENAEEFDRSCDIIQSEVAKCTKDTDVFFQLVVFHENASPEEILVNGRALSPDGKKVADEIRKLHPANFPKNAFHSFDSIYQTYGEIEKLDFLKLTYGVLCVLNYSHFPPLIAEDFKREMPNCEEACLFALPSILNSSVRDFVNCFDWTSFLMRTKMLSEKQPEPQESLPESQPVEEPVPEPQPQKEQHSKSSKVSLEKNPKSQPTAETKPKEETSNEEDDSESISEAPEIPKKSTAREIKKIERTTTQGGTSQPQGKSGTNNLSKLIPIAFGVFAVVVVAVVWEIFRNIPIAKPPIGSSSEVMDSSVMMDGDSNNDSDSGSDNAPPNSPENRTETGHIIEHPPVEDEDSSRVEEGQAPVPPETQPVVNQLEGEQGEETESRYFVVVGKFTWEEAEKFCVSEGGHLASIHSEEDWNEIVAELERFQARNEDLKYFWLGGYSTIENSNIEFSWTDNTPTSYLYQCSHWYFSERTGKREPSGYNDDDGKREPYLMIWKPANSTSWSLNDVPDVTDYSAYKESNMGFVMERSVPSNVEQVTAEVEHSPEPEPEPVTVAVPQPIEPEDTPDLTEHFVRNNAFFAASATSQLDDIVTAWKRYVYSPKNVLNEDSDSCWAEGVEGDGIGESITLYADSPQLIRKICICNGLCSDKETFYRNNRIDECTILFDDGEYFITLNLSGSWYEQPEYFLLENPIYASSVTFRIDSVFQGIESDTAITGIYFSSE